MNGTHTIVSFNVYDINWQNSMHASYNQIFSSVYGLPLVLRKLITTYHAMLTRSGIGRVALWVLFQYEKVRTMHQHALFSIITLHIKGMYGEITACCSLPHSLVWAMSFGSVERNCGVKLFSPVWIYFEALPVDQIHPSASRHTFWTSLASEYFG